jgi:predicted HicB family RNase H-like nuclease
MARRRVGDWPTYLLNGVPDSERRLLSASAAAQNTSVSDVVRSILCARYRMICPRESYYYDAERDTGSTTLLLRLQPKLDAALKRHAARTGRSRRRLILETITSHYKEGEPS